MIDHKTIDDLARRLSEALPDGVRNLQQDIEKNIRAVLTSTFSRLDLVTREELEVQQEVLARTRARLETLEQKLAELEAGGNKPATPAQE
jgi:BMFP domain-containing protein YqiC